MTRDRTLLLDQEAFHAAASAGQADGRGVTRAAGRIIRAPTEASSSRTLRFCFSDGSVDRMGDTIDPAGWITSDFMRNPVCLWSHDSSEPPIGRVKAVWSDGTKLMGDIEFIGPETYDFADLVFRLLKGGWLNAVSVGFIPLDYEFCRGDQDRPGGIDFKRQSLLEISICPVPANANALVEARAKGIVGHADLRRLTVPADDGGTVRRMKAALAKRNELERQVSQRTWSETADDRRRRARAMRRRLLRNVMAEPVSDTATPALLRQRAIAIRAAVAPRRPDPRAAIANAAFRLRSF